MLCRSGADFLFDLLIAAGCVRKVVIGYLGNPGIGLAHAFRRAVEAGTLEVEDWTNFAMMLRLHAGALEVPYLPRATLNGGDLPNALGIETVVCPYINERLSAVPALRCGHPACARRRRRRQPAARRALRGRSRGRSSGWPMSRAISSTRGRRGWRV